MNRLTIVVGDTTNHGGTVTTGDARLLSNGLATAHVGSEVLCPLHGATTIVTGQNHIPTQGEPVAIEGDLTSCGAHLISRRQSTCWVGGQTTAANSSASVASPATSSAAPAFAASTPAQHAAASAFQRPEVLCDERFQFLTPQRKPLGHLIYGLLQHDQCIAYGTLDEQGLSRIHGGPSPASLQLVIGAPSPAVE